MFDRPDSLLPSNNNQVIINNSVVGGDSINSAGDSDTRNKY